MISILDIMVIKLKHFTIKIIMNHKLDWWKINLIKLIYLISIKQEVNLKLVKIN